MNYTNHHDPNMTHRMLSAREIRERHAQQKERERVASGLPSAAQTERARQAAELRQRAKQLRGEAAKLEADANVIDPPNMDVAAPGSDLLA